MYNKRAIDPVRLDLASLAVRNKTLLAELRNLQSKLAVKEASLQEMKAELDRYKESSKQQVVQIESLRDDIGDLKELVASLMKIKILKNTSFQSPERDTGDLNERVMKLENHLRVHLMEREKAERKADFLEKKLSCASRVSPLMHQKGQEDSLDIFPVKDKGEAIPDTDLERCNISCAERPDDVQKIWDKCPPDLTHVENQPPESDRQPYSCNWEQAQHQNFLSQLATLLSDSIGPIPATEEAVKERIQEMGAQEQLWKSHGSFLQENSRIQKSLTDKHTKKFKQLEMLLNIRQNSRMTTAPRMEEKIQKLQKQLSDLKLSNKNMKTQLTRINVLKDKTIEKLRQSLTKVETEKGKAAPKVDNLKITLAPAEAARPDKERARQPPAGAPREPHSAKSAQKGSSPAQEQQLMDFRETIMKMLGFDLKTADKDIINQLQLVIQVYEIAKKAKMSSGGETGQRK